MTSRKQQWDRIASFLREKLQQKIKKYERETTVMPFLSNLMQNEEMVATFSFIHSLNTTLGASIYEQLAKIIAQSTASGVGTHVKMDGTISPARKIVIDRILDDLRSGRITANKVMEIKEILSASKEGGTSQKARNVVDFYMKRNDVEYYFEIKTAKPNIGEMTTAKTTLLEWVARKDKPVKTILAIPYNPYEPSPYERFTEVGLLDKKEELMVGREFWDFLGGEGMYDNLLDIFNNIGKEFHDIINSKIKDVASRSKFSRDRLV